MVSKFRLDSADTREERGLLASGGAVASDMVG